MQGRPLVVDEQRRLPVQPEPPHRRQLPVHRRPHERIGERQAPGGRARGRVEQSGGARLLHLAERPVHVGQGGGGGQRDTVTDHGGGLDEAPRAVAAGREPAADHPAEHPGGGQHGLPTLPAVGRCLHQQREHMAGIAEGVGAQAVRHQPRDRRPGRGGGQRLDVGRRQRTDLDGDAGVPLGEPPEPGRQAGLVRRHHQDRQHRIRRQPAHREQQRSKRVHVRPVRIVDHDHHRSRDAAPDQRGENQAAHHDRFLDRQHPLDVRQERASPEAHGPEELVHQGVGDGGLALVATAAYRRQVRVVVEESADQRGLADPRSPPHQRDAGTVGAHLREQRVQDAEFVLAPDERLIPQCCPARGAQWRRGFGNRVGRP